MAEPRRPGGRRKRNPSAPRSVDISPEELQRLTPETLQRLKDEHGLDLRIRSTVAGVDKLLGELGRKLDDDGEFTRVEFDRGDPGDPDNPFSKEVFDRVDPPESLGEHTNPSRGG